MTAAPAIRRPAKRRRLEVAPDRIHQVSISRIRTSRENDRLYRPVDPEDVAIISLAESIEKNGVLEPLVITRDGYILSGHRRYAAATMVGLETVPCRFEAVRYVNLTEDERVKLLALHNQQRVKSIDEMIREQVVTASEDDAYEELEEYRRQKSDKSGIFVPEIELSARRERSGISRRKFPMLDAVIEVIKKNCDFLPLSDRQIHYGLLNDPPFRNSKRPDSKYGNERQSYQDLCDLLTRARLCGMIPWNAIADTTRPCTEWKCYSNPQDYIRDELDDLFKGYFRDLQRSQPAHIEIIGEKLTIANMIRPVAARYRITFTIGRGYSSIQPRYELAQRFRKSGKDKLIVLILSDFDPDGEAIAESFARSMRDDFGIDNLQPIKVALTSDQVDQLKLKPQMVAKIGSAHHKKFTQRYGEDVFELESLPPKKLPEILEQQVRKVLDLDDFENERNAERRDASELANARQRACLALGNMAEALA